MSKNLFTVARDDNRHKTIDKQIVLLAEAFSDEGDIHGVYILERAAEEAKKLKPKDVRQAEFDVLMARRREISKYYKDE